MMHRSSHQRCSMKKGDLRNITKLTEKHLCQGLFFIAATLLKKRLWHRCFPVNFMKFLRKPFLQNTSGRLLLDVTCFAKVSLLLLKSCNMKVIITFRFIKKKLAHIKRSYHSFRVEIIVESVNLIEMPKQKIFITMMENN